MSKNNYASVRDVQTKRLENNKVNESSEDDIPSINIPQINFNTSYVSNPGLLDKSRSSISPSPNVGKEEAKNGLTPKAFEAK